MQARKELDDLTVTQPAVSQELPDYSSTSTRPQRHYAMHVSVGLAALCTWWYYLQDVPALERKLLSVLLSPVRFAYLLGMYSEPYSDLACAACAACGDCTYSSHPWAEAIHSSTAWLLYAHIIFWEYMSNMQC